jgi:hypothetical protein
MIDLTEQEQASMRAAMHNLGEAMAGRSFGCCLTARRRLSAIHTSRNQ